MRLRYAPSTGRRLPSSMTDVSTHPRDVLRHAAFRGFWIAVLASRLAMQILTVAVGWYIYDLTGSALALGFVGLVQFAPLAVMALPAGWLADHVDRRRILPSVLAFECAVVAAMTVLLLRGALDTTALYALLALLGSARAFEQPLASSLIPLLVPGPLLKTALALNSTGSQAVIISGPALGGALYLLGPSVVFTAVTALFALACFLGVQLAR